MTFTVFMYALGGYAVVLLAALLVLERTRGPVPQQAGFSYSANRPSLRPWSRSTRGCSEGHQRALPLRTTQLAAPPRRRRPTATSCRR